ncbi:MAG: hypothetical protein IPH84_10760 [Bacteroidales bacterium]|nr:hypothetical protein [Bacteroidales bacterium]
MTRKLLFSLIGAIILFAWLFLSNAMPNFHKAASTYTPKQAELLQKIQESGLEEGMYMLGQPDPSESGRTTSFHGITGRSTGFSYLWPWE